MRIFYVSIIGALISNCVFALSPGGSRGADEIQGPPHNETQPSTNISIQPSEAQLEDTFCHLAVLQLGLTAMLDNEQVQLRRELFPGAINYIRRLIEPQTRLFDEDFLGMLEQLNTAMNERGPVFWLTRRALDAAIRYFERNQDQHAILVQQELSHYTAAARDLGGIPLLRAQALPVLQALVDAEMVRVYTLGRQAAERVYTRFLQYWRDARGRTIEAPNEDIVIEPIEALTARVLQRLQEQQRLSPISLQIAC